MSWKLIPALSSSGGGEVPKEKRNQDFSGRLKQSRALLSRKLLLRFTPFFLSSFSSFHFSVSSHSASVTFPKEATHLPFHFGSLIAFTMGGCVLCPEAPAQQLKALLKGTGAKTSLKEVYIDCC